MHSPIGAFNCLWSSIWVTIFVFEKSHKVEKSSFSERKYLGNKVEITGERICENPKTFDLIPQFLLELEIEIKILPFNQFTFISYAMCVCSFFSFFLWKKMLWFILPLSLCRKANVIEKKKKINLLEWHKLFQNTK